MVLGRIAGAILPSFGKVAGGVLDKVTGDRFDFDNRGKGLSQQMPVLRENSDFPILGGSISGMDYRDFQSPYNIPFQAEDAGKGFLGKLVEGIGSYNPEKNVSEEEKFLRDFTTKRGSGGGGVSRVADNLSLYTPPDNSVERAQVQQMEQQQQQQKKDSKRMAGSALGTAVGSIFGPIGGAVGGFLGGLFCDIRLKEDIAPLSKSDVNDVLSECAFFVKDLNECS